MLRGPWRPSPQAQGKTRKTEAHKGVKLGVSSREGAGSNSLPHGSMFPTDPLTLEASIPGAALGSWGTPERGGVLRGSWGRGHCLLSDSQHRHLWRKRTIGMGWVPGSRQGQASSGPWCWGAGGHVAGRTQPGVETRTHRGPELHQK